MLITFISSFVVRIYFVRYLGFENLGVIAALTSIVTLLCIIDFGAGIALQFSLYKPLAENDTNKISILLNLYKKLYFIIALAIFVFGLIALPLLPIFTGYSFLTALPIYLIILVTNITSYLFSYNHTLISADQKEYIKSFVLSVLKIITAAAQILVLILFKNILLYLLVLFLSNLILNIFIWAYVRRKYPYTKKANGKLDKGEFQTIRKKMSAIVLHKISGTIVVSLDALLISLFVSVTILGYYSNYLLISSSIFALMGGVFNGLSPYFGNANATSSREHLTDVFKKMRFLYFIVCTVAVTGIFVVGDYFLELWLSEETILPFMFLVVFCFNFFQAGYAVPLSSIRAAVGAYEPDRYYQFLIAGVKLGLGILLTICFGITGLLLASVISSAIPYLIIIPLVCHKYVYNIKQVKYLLRFLFDFAVACACVVATYFVVYIIPLSLSIWSFILYGLICVIVPLIIVCLVYFWTKEFKGFKTFALTFVKRFRIKPSTKSVSEEQS